MGEGLQEVFMKLLPAVAAAVLSVLVLWVTQRVLHRGRLEGEGGFRHHVIMLVLTGIALGVVILTLPVAPETRRQLLGLLGLILTGVIAFSSTALVSNAMGGLMLRSVNSFRPGDFIRVGDQFGRVTERGLFHTEIQTEHRDLTTLPNLYLVTHPVTVVHSEGTVVSATLSLGYDAHHGRVRSLLEGAAHEASLEEPFVRILELGDHAVTYRVAGFLPETKKLLRTRSLLREKALDALHGAGLEIVSPSFMNQRALDPSAPVIPRAPVQVKEDDSESDSLVFDKAEQAERAEELRDEREALLAQIKELEAGAAGGDKQSRKVEIERLRVRVEAVERRIERVRDAGRPNS
jgi:small-conductance mechanosensitive channel